MFIRLLTRSATGEPITQYTSHFAGPRAGGEMHIVLVDNGRTQRLADERFRPSLKCIRCGACMNTCPVYRRCPVQINIHDQIYQWREVMDTTGEFSTTKKAAMKLAGNLLSHPKAYRAATEAGSAALRVLPHFAIYNRLNAWGRHRDIPSPVKETFHQWYTRNRGGTHPAQQPAGDAAPGTEDTGHGRA